jgi:hypothetical protein
MKTLTSLQLDLQVKLEISSPIFQLEIFQILRISNHTSIPCYTISPGLMGLKLI